MSETELPPVADVPQARTKTVRATDRVIHIKELDIHSIRPRTGAADETGGKYIIIGKPGSGKSVLIKYIVYMKKHIFPVANIVSGTEDSNKFFQECFPPVVIHDALSVELIQRFKKRQKLVAELIPENPWALLINDDCMDDTQLFRKPIFQDLFKNGRHWKMLYILGMQYAMDIPPALRTCIDGAFIFREPNLRNRKILYENYAGVIPSFDMFCSILDQITDDFTALFVDNRTTSNNFEECIFWIKAEEIQGFKFGCEDYWLFHKDRFDEDYKKF